MKLLIITFSLILCSCSSYVNKMHQSFDNHDTKGRRVKPKSKDKFAMYRGRDSRFNSPSTKTHHSMSPNTQRNYLPERKVKKRYRADDLTDTQNKASLWGNDDYSQFLFTQTTEKKTGEIVVINVMTQLKKDIAAELKRRFPDPPAIKKKAVAVEGAEKQEKEPVKVAAKPKPEPAKEAAAGNVHDRISSVIIEKINTNHLLLKGRKTLLYKKRKRTVEVQALISKKHITGEDSIDSDNILESNIRVLR